MNNIDYYAANLESYPLSGKEVEAICGDGTQVVVYHELPNFKSIEQLLGNTRSVILLYETKYNVGHYCSLYFDKNNILHFFDPYGMEPDEELNYAHYNHTPFLTNLLKQFNGKLIVSKFPFQKESNHINTCGRWSATRIRTKNIFNNLEFEKLLGDKDLRNSPDWYVSIITLLFTLHKG